MITNFRDKKERISTYIIVEFLQSMLKSLKTIYKNDLTHGNLHPGNIMCSDVYSDLAISDIGLFKFNDFSDLKPQNIMFFAPEILKLLDNDDFNLNFKTSDIEKRDVYSIGVIILVLMTCVDLDLKQYIPAKNSKKGYISQKNFIADAKILASKYYSNVWYRFAYILDIILDENVEKRPNIDFLMNLQDTKNLFNMQVSLLNKRFNTDNKLK